MQEDPRERQSGEHELSQCIEWLTWIFMIEMMQVIYCSIGCPGICSGSPICDPGQLPMGPPSFFNQQLQEDPKAREWWAGTVSIYWMIDMNIYNRNNTSHLLRNRLPRYLSWIADRWSRSTTNRGPLHPFNQPLQEDPREREWWPGTVSVYWMIDMNIYDRIYANHVVIGQMLVTCCW